MYKESIQCRRKTNNLSKNFQRVVYFHCLCDNIKKQNAFMRGNMASDTKAALQMRLKNYSTDQFGQ